MRHSLLQFYVFAQDPIVRKKLLTREPETINILLDNLQKVFPLYKDVQRTTKRKFEYILKFIHNYFGIEAYERGVLDFDPLDLFNFIKKEIPTAVQLHKNGDVLKNEILSEYFYRFEKICNREGVTDYTFRAILGAILFVSNFFDDEFIKNNEYDFFKLLGQENYESLVKKGEQNIIVYERNQSTYKRIIKALADETKF